jgi:holo-[acyl-carrier protein] synthase
LTQTIPAVGIDIVDIDRFRSVLNRWGDRFAERILTKSELEYCKKKVDGTASMAARFAAKEAMIKCLPQTFVFHWHEMEILNRENGAPQVFLTGRLAALMRDKKILLSLSHSVSSAVAVVMIQE